MTQGLPPKPTCFSIIGGILLAVAVLAAFALLPNIVKWVGAVLTFVPSRLGIIEVVSPGEVSSVDFSTSPTDVVFARPGKYAVFTLNYDLLSINDAVLAAKAKPWFRLIGPDGDEVAITLIERGMALYDTPFAGGRPVARFDIVTAGTYSMTHPRRPDFVYVVPDYTRGQESATSFYMFVQAAALGVAVWYLRRRERMRRIVIVPPPPSRLTRERFKAEQAELDRSLPASAPTSWESAPSTAVSMEPAAVADARDVLQLVREKVLTTRQAEAEIEAMMLSQPTGRQSGNWGASLALTASEAAAYSQGAGVADLLNWRYETWPSTCAKCAQPLDYRDLAWWFVRDEMGIPGLRHINCPTKTS